MPQDNQPIIQLRSEPVQDIIGRDPNWIIRWGITVITSIITVLLISTYIIKYPDVVSSRIVFTTQTPPMRVVARSSGKLIDLFVKEGEIVVADQYLAVLENTAHFPDMVNLRDRIGHFQDFVSQPEGFPEVQWESNVNLGNVQVAYSSFLSAFEDYRSFLKEDFTGQKIGAIRQQINRYQNLNKQLENQREITLRQLEIARQKYEKNKQLFQEKLISETDFATVEGQYLDRQSDLESADSSMTNNRIRIEELNRSILELGQDGRERERSLLLVLQGAFKRLTTEFESWEQTYVLKAPVGGKVSFFSFWSDNQYVTAGDEVITVIPEIDQLIGQIYLPQYGAGKVTQGQQVNIKFDSYPFKDYGMVHGRVESISLIAREDQYLVKVSLPDGLKTTYHKELGFKHNMGGSSDIITENMRLIERIFNQLRHLFHANL